MNLGVSRLVAGGFALSAFAIAIVAGLAAGNPSGRILTTALIVMIVCNLVGLGIGMIAERIVAEHIQAQRDGRPLRTVAAAEGAQPTTDQKIDRRS